MAILAEFGYLADFGGQYTYLAKFVTFVLNTLETWFWCLYPAFWAWEIHWDQFQTPWIGLSDQIVIYGGFWQPNILSSDAQKLLISYLKLCGPKKGLTPRDSYVRIWRLNPSNFFLTKTLVLRRSSKLSARELIYLVKSDFWWISKRNHEANCDDM